jgi:hypothetical protein
MNDEEVARRITEQVMNVQQAISSLGDGELVDVVIRYQVLQEICVQNLDQLKTSMDVESEEDKQMFNSLMIYSKELARRIISTTIVRMEVEK